MTREEAIQVLKEISATLKSWSDFSEYPQAIDMAIEKLSAEPKTGWIPVSERLPAEDGEYLVAYPMACAETETEVDILNYGNPTIPNEKVCGRCWYDSDSEYGDIVYDDVVAWMPLPEPYKGGDTE